MSLPDDSNQIEDGLSGDTYVEGVVIRSTGSWYDVRVADAIVPSTVRGRFRLQEDDATNPIAVGDRVTIRMNPDETGLIMKIHDRMNQLSRRAAGRRVGREHVIIVNIDTVWIIQSVRMPAPNAGFIDRVLVTTEAHDLRAGIVFNKTDLLRGEDAAGLDSLRALYEGLGYPVLLTSAESGDGVDAFTAELEGRTSVLTGPSGVGKSSLLNVVEPGLDIRTADVSEKTRKGRHTTTYAALFPLSGGGYIADTPGIREFGLLHIEPWELSHYFVEFREPLETCRFPTCTHDHEPSCGVKAAVEAGEISDKRYRNYLNMLDSVRRGERDVGR